MRQALLKKIWLQTESYHCPMTKEEFSLACQLRTDGFVQRVRGTWSLTRKGFNEDQ